MIGANGASVMPVDGALHRRLSNCAELSRLIVDDDGCHVSIPLGRQYTRERGSRELQGDLFIAQGCPAIRLLAGIGSGVMCMQVQSSSTA